MYVNRKFAILISHGNQLIELEQTGRRLSYSANRRVFIETVSRAHHRNFLGLCVLARAIRDGRYRGSCASRDGEQFRVRLN